MICMTAPLPNQSFSGFFLHKHIIKKLNAASEFRSSDWSKLKFSVTRHYRIESHHKKFKTKCKAKLGEQDLKAVNYFCEMLRHRCMMGILLMPAFNSFKRRSLSYRNQSIYLQSKTGFYMIRTSDKKVLNVCKIRS